MEASSLKKLVSKDYSQLPNTSMIASGECCKGAEVIGIPMDDTIKQKIEKDEMEKFEGQGINGI